MTLLETIEAVISITKRADKRTEILSNINKAIAFYTLKADFSRDLSELTIPIDSTVYGQTIDLTTLASPPTRFRKVKWLKPTGRRYYFKLIDPGVILTPQGQVQTDRFYTHGQNITITQSNYDSTIEMGYLSYADVLQEGQSPVDTHWMLDLMPWAIIERAASQTFKSIGDDVSSKFYEQSSMEFFVTARNDFEIQIADSAS